MLLGIYRRAVYGLYLFLPAQRQFTGHVLGFSGTRMSPLGTLGEMTKKGYEYV